MLQIIGVKENDDFCKKALSKFAELKNVDRLRVELLNKNDGVIRTFLLVSPVRTRQRFVFLRGFQLPMCVGSVKQNGVVSYVGDDLTCGQFVAEAERPIDDLKTFFKLSAMGIPVSGVSRTSLQNLFDEMGPNSSIKNVVEWLITKEKMNASTKEREMIQKIVGAAVVATAKKNQQYPFLPIMSTKVNGIDVVTIGYGPKEFVVGYDNKIVVLPYVLGGLRAIEKSAFLHRLNRSSEIRER